MTLLGPQPRPLDPKYSAPTISHQYHKGGRGKLRAEKHSPILKFSKGSWAHFIRGGGRESYISSCPLSLCCKEVTSALCIEMSTVTDVHL